MIIQKRIQHARNLRGYSQEYLAKKLGMTQQNYSEIETGHLKLSDDLLLKILEILDMGVMAFMEFDPDLVFQSTHQQGGQYNAAHTINNETGLQFIQHLKQEITEMKEEVNFWKDEYLARAA